MEKASLRSPSSNKYKSLGDERIYLTSCYVEMLKILVFFLSRFDISISFYFGFVLLIKALWDNLIHPEE